MRDIQIKVTGQQIEVIGNCDGIVAGSQNYLQAVFEFSDEWNNCIKIASFWSKNKEYPVLVRNDKCMIPDEALTERYFKVSVLGQRGDYRITSDKIKIMQEVPN